ncbi:FtsX-like permease family protein [Streptomyces albus]|uniref:FtsX-like permease family protein n=1 Tax=Streptomyces albus TaxID=1888 RepID=UPI0006E1B213|nr:ABC transporter permease [Streptomyces albus]
MTAQRSGGARLRTAARDLAMGGRFALSGRQGWVRTLLTAVGVGLGVAMLLLAASVPHIAQVRQERTHARDLNPSGDYGQGEKPGDHTLLAADAKTTYHGKEIYGYALQPEGKHPLVPPGIDALPAPGRMYVSPALKKLLRSDEGGELARRLDSRIVGTIGDEGLEGPQELAFYMGAEKLSPPGTGTARVTRIGDTEEGGPIPPVVVLLGVVACVVLLMPVAVFIGAAARFGGDRRDRRLAALRLVGADAAMARRVAAGESLVGAVLGLFFGAAVFALGRHLLGGVSLFGLSVFPSAVVPGLALGALIVLGVPVTAVAVSVFALRGVAIEPLGVVREAEPGRRRLWWRLLPPLAGALLLLPLSGEVENTPQGDVHEVQVVGGVLLLLSGVGLLLPWVVERLVARLKGGGISGQLAVRRLQLNSGAATRAVSGITIAVAGAIALQMLFQGVAKETTVSTGDRADAQRIGVRYVPVGHSLTGSERLTAALRKTDGVRRATGYLESYQQLVGKDKYVAVGVGSCDTLREIAAVGSCRDGQSFRVEAPRGKGEVPPPPAGTKVRPDTEDDSQDSKPGRVWKVPASARTVTALPDIWGEDSFEGLLLTPGAMPKGVADDAVYVGRVQLAAANADALEHVRTTVFREDPAASVITFTGSERNGYFVMMQRVILAAAVGVMVLIGASLVISMLEQLRERKRQLAVLVAFGTRRTTLGASVLWQSAVPVVLGLVLASGFGMLLGWALLRLIDQPVADWLVFLPMAGVGAGLIAVVTLLSLPVLWRLMRPDGLRSE